MSVGALARAARADLSPWGAVLGGLAVAASFSPSLLPRTWPLQGAAAGITGALVYLVTVLVVRLVREVATLAEVSVGITVRATRAVRIGVAVLLGLAFLAYGLWALAEQRTTARLVLMPPPPWWHPVLALGLAIVVAAACIAVARVLRRASEAVARHLPRAVPRWVAVTAGALVVATTTVALTDAVLVSRVSQALGERFYEINAQVREGFTPPTTDGRSGGPGSGVAWESLGQEGQVFVAGGPDAARITRVTGAPAVEPVRVYAGLETSGSIDEAADRVVDELRRTGAFERSVLVVYFTTGTGWVNEWSAQSVEYLTGGDSAIAAMQYSYLPSPLALISDRVSSPRAARALFDRVQTEVLSLPADDRPQLMVAGESLGSFGGHGAFADAEQMLADVDGGVWVGTPAFTPLWRTITDERQQGSPEVAPVVDNGRHLRFATRAEDLEADLYGRPLGEWEEPRIAYLQHASDPISRWDGDLLLSRPDWISERAGTDVNPEVRWLPLVTFWQVTTDQAVGNSTQQGHGHIYHDDVVTAWAAVLGAEGTDVGPVIEAIRSR
ncbi:alpha/beta hydrolase [Ornithinimicrobium sp. LYQ92]|uniref:alpha/beta hydrolase n=1 Tax=Serinicoccus sp. LYQ92 TaxID=3378798 RepID=UPI003854E28F